MRLRRGGQETRQEKKTHTHTHAQLTNGSPIPNAETFVKIEAYILTHLYFLGAWVHIFIISKQSHEIDNLQKKERHRTHTRTKER